MSRACSAGKVHLHTGQVFCSASQVLMQAPQNPRGRRAAPSMTGPAAASGSSSRPAAAPLPAAGQQHRQLPAGTSPADSLKSSPGLPQLHLPLPAPATALFPLLLLLAPQLVRARSPGPGVDSHYQRRRPTSPACPGQHVPLLLLPQAARGTSSSSSSTTTHTSSSSAGWPQACRRHVQALELLQPVSSHRKPTGQR